MQLTFFFRVSAKWDFVFLFQCMLHKLTFKTFNNLYTYLTSHYVYAIIMLQLQGLFEVHKSSWIKLVHCGIASHLLKWRQYKNGLCIHLFVLSKGSCFGLVKKAITTLTIAFCAIFLIFLLCSQFQNDTMAGCHKSFQRWAFTLKKTTFPQIPLNFSSSATILSNTTVTTCLTVAAAVLLVMLSLVKWRRKHSTIAWKKNRRQCTGGSVQYRPCYAGNLFSLLDYTHC